MTAESIREHHAAATGDLDALREAARTDPAALLRADENGWQPIHEAIRTGDLEAVKFLLASGADKDAVAGGVGTNLYLARELLDEDHEIILHLESLGAIDAEADEL